MKSWFRSLATAPAPLTPPERVLVALVAAGAAVSRLAAIARTPWDWDEMLFMLGMRHYDVAAHHPHPPGFPLWMAAADLLHALGLSEFRALQALAVAGAVAIVPATFFLCRELRMGLATALGAAVLLAFFPNVWLYGGTALSDVPSMTLVVVAIALLLAGCRDGRFYFAGAVVLAAAAGFRPQNLLIGLAPALLASAFRRRREVVMAALLGAAIVGLSYAIAIDRTGWPAYREAVSLHGQYIAQVDSYRSAARPPLWRVFVEFFVRPYRMPPINVAVTLFVTIASVARCVKRRPQVVVLLATFGPFCLFAWLMLDRYSASRFSIGYAPLMAILAADGVAIAARLASVEVVVDALLVGAMAVWTWPALYTVRTTDAPPVAAIHWVGQHVDRTTPLYVHRGMAPYAEALLAGVAPRFVDAPPLLWSGPVPLYLAELESGEPGATNFRREHGHLWWIARQRYFEVSIRPVAERAHLLSGWYGEETAGTAQWRWMGARSVTHLPPARSGRARLGLDFYVPRDVLHANPNVTVWVNGIVVARIHAASDDLTITRDVAARVDAVNELVIATDHAVQPPHDTRLLGLRLNEMEWR